MPVFLAVKVMLELFRKKNHGQKKKYLSSNEWLKYLGHLEPANSFLFCCVLLLVFASDKLRLRVAVPLKLVFSVKRKITGRPSGGCLSPNKA